MTKSEKKEYYKDIRDFERRGFKVVIIPHKAWEVLLWEVPSQQRLCIPDKFIQMVRVGEYYIFSDVEDSYGECFDKLIKVMAGGILKDPNCTEYMKVNLQEIAR